MQFQLQSKYKPAGDQPRAIAGIIDSLKSGNKHQTLLGVTGSGKSVVRDTPVLIKYHNSTKRVLIGELIDSLFAKYGSRKHIVKDTEYIKLVELPKEEQFQTFSLNPRTKTQGWSAVTEISRHQAPSILHSLSTTCGKSITTTGDHNFFVLRSGCLELLPTTELRTGDWIPAPLRIPEPEQPLQRLNLADITSSLPRRYYIAAPRLLEVPEQHQNMVYATIGYRKGYRVLKKSERLPTKAFAELAIALPQITAQATVGTYHGAKLPMQLELTPGLLRLFAYYIAEGCATPNYITISSGSVEITNDLQTTCAALGLDAKHRPGTYDYQISSSLLRDTLVSLCGKGSYNKYLPAFWPELSNQQLSALLSAYFSCDGGVDGDEVTATTASKSLASDIVFALLRFNIRARVKRRQIKIPNSDKRGFYYCIRISGKDNLTAFKDTIGFYIQSKQTKLTTIIKPIANTNVDLIPWGKELKQLRPALALLQKDIATAIGIERSYISMLEDGKRLPSRTIFAKLVNFLIVSAAAQGKTAVQVRLQSIQELEKLSWTPIKTLDQLPGEGYVYDFSVHTNETFLAGHGGLFVHNTFTMANVVQELQRPTLVMCHNKTLAAQLASEFQEFFPHNAIHYFVSYYDYYQPEAYIPRSDTYVEKETQINEEIDRLRNAATQSLLTRKDVLIVASVSCIYGLGNPGDYMELSIEIKRGQSLKRDKLLRRLTDLQFTRNDFDLKRGTYRAQGDTIEIVLASEDTLVRLEFFGDEVEKIERRDLLTGETLDVMDSVHIFPAKHFVTTEEKIHSAIDSIRSELLERLAELRTQGKVLEAARLEQRTNFDIEMLTNTGFVAGIENYSRHMDGRLPGDPPSTLIDYFPDDFLLFVDESHQTIPQVGAMYNGDRARKVNLVDYGFRLPSAMDNRPLQFSEFEGKIDQVVYVSATPGPYELRKSLVENSSVIPVQARLAEAPAERAGIHSPAIRDTQDSLVSELDPRIREDDNTHANDLRGITVVEQIIRPTGLIDPTIEIKPIKHQVDDLLEQIIKRTKVHQRVLVTTLTKRMSEELTEYLKEANVKVQYIHSEVETFDRLEILKDLRLGVFDVLVGINLLREGLDLPEVSLVAILDADKEGFLRSETAFMQIMGRAARHLNGHVIMYADRMTGSMERAITETTRRRKLQEEYNTKHGITPQSIQKAISDTRLAGSKIPEALPGSSIQEVDPGKLSKEELKYYLEELENQMDLAAKNLEFELAATLRDKITAAKKLSKLRKK